MYLTFVALNWLTAGDTQQTRSKLAVAQAKKSRPKRRKQKTEQLTEQHPPMTEQPFPLLEQLFSILERSSALLEQLPSAQNLIAKFVTDSKDQYTTQRVVVIFVRSLRSDRSQIG